MNPPFDFLRGILEQLSNPGLGREITEEQVNFMLSVASGAPRQLASLFGVVIAYAQSATVMVGTDLLSWENFKHRESSERSFTRLAKTLSDLANTQMRLLASGAQTTTVQQNVSVYDGGQAAVVGNLTQAQRDNAPDTPAVSPPMISDATTAPMPNVGKSKKRAAGVTRYRPKYV